MEVDPKAADPPDAVRRVRDAALAVGLAGASRERRQDGVLDLVARERRLGEREEAAVDPNGRRRSRDEEQVRSLLVDERREPAIETGRIAADLLGAGIGAGGRGSSLSSRIRRLRSSVSAIAASLCPAPRLTRRQPSGRLESG
jgi:hypothetical protein